MVEDEITNDEIEEVSMQVAEPEEATEQNLISSQNETTENEVEEVRMDAAQVEKEVPLMVTPSAKVEPETPKTVEEQEPTVRHQLEDTDTEKEAGFSTIASKLSESNNKKEDEDEFSLEPVLKKTSGTTVVANSESNQPKKNQAPQMSNEERQKMTQERMARLRNLSNQLKTPSGITSIENEPAFKRRSVKLDDIEHSSESQISRLTLTESEDEDGNKKTELRSNNSFLHDNVD